jgi:hypothetical protein
LQENTKYYYKAYATNTKGTSYGEVQSFTTLAEILRPPKDNNDHKNIIGKTFKVGTLEIAQYDFGGKMDWQQATNSCLSLGTTWRLPTLADYKVIFDEKTFLNSQININEYYWSSSELGSFSAYRFLDNRYISTRKDGNYGIARCLKSL